MTSESSKTLKKTSSKEIDMATLKKYKVFNDPIHGTVSLHPLLVNIIDTPQFQRLRYIKQLGGGYFVYPGASHNRFEHSIGVAHLAGELVKALQTKQPKPKNDDEELNISDRDVLCVQIAGLCHDMGHGPFSHLFETFIHRTRPDKGWKHEEASLMMFDHMMKCDDLKKKMKQYGLVLDIDVTFIKEMIKGWSPVDPLPKGRPNKLFLYEIVANKRNGIDVDKFDYLARDAHHLGIKENFDHLRFIQFARVWDVDGVQQICTRDKEVNNLYDLFHLRYCLHRRAYQHKVNKIIESMILEAFVKADKHIKIEGSGKKMFTLSTAIDDMEAYTKLTDDVFGQIFHSSDPKLAEATEILKRIVSRQHYRFLAETKLTEAMITKGMTPQDVEAMKGELAKACVRKGDGLKADDFEVHIVKMDYGMKDQDPIKKVRFYSKSDPTKGVPLTEDQESMFKPTCFSEQLIRVYCKKIDETSLSDAREHMIEWCNKKGLPTPE